MQDVIQEHPGSTAVGGQELKQYRVGGRAEL